MSRLLKEILSGVKSSTIVPMSTGTDPGVDYDSKAKGGRDFVAKHKVQKHADRVGNKNPADAVKQANYKRADRSQYEETQIDETNKENKAKKNAVFDKVGQKFYKGVDAPRPNERRAGRSIATSPLWSSKKFKNYATESLGDTACDDNLGSSDTLTRSPLPSKKNLSEILNVLSLDESLIGERDEGNKLRKNIMVIQKGKALGATNVTKAKREGRKLLNKEETISELSKGTLKSYIKGVGNLDWKKNSLSRLQKHHDGVVRAGSKIHANKEKPRYLWNKVKVPANEETISELTTKLLHRYAGKAEASYRHKAYSGKNLTSKDKSRKAGVNLSQRKIADHNVRVPGSRHPNASVLDDVKDKITKDTMKNTPTTRRSQR